MRMTSGMEESGGKFPPLVDKFDGLMMIKMEEKRENEIEKGKKKKEKRKEKKNEGRKVKRRKRRPFLGRDGHRTEKERERGGEDRGVERETLHSL